jgi:hypothetical protein
MIDAQAIALLDHMPSHAGIRLALGAIIALLALACLYTAHAPRRCSRK